MSVLTLAEIIRTLERRYPPVDAEPWDAVGLAVGDPERPVRKVLFAVDPVAETVAEAVGWGADLLVTHHPLFLAGVHSVAADSAKGRLVHRLVESRCAQYAAHTNADAAVGGVAECLAQVVGLADVRPLVPAAGRALDLLITYVPSAAANSLLAALAGAGAGRLGDYEECAWTVEGLGRFRPLAGAHPAVGRVGDLEQVIETRIEVVVESRHRDAVVAALRAAHPYEEPAFSLVPTVATGSRTGSGRIGSLPEPTTLGDFARFVARSLPRTAQGVRVAGPLNHPVRRVAVCGGSGGSLLGSARGAGADVFLTADLKHHLVSEAREEGPPYLIDAAHWATEWPWLRWAARDLEADVRALGANVETRVSTTVTDPWTERFAPRPSDRAAGPELSGENP